MRGYRKRDVVVCFVKLRESLRQQLVKAEILESTDSEFVYGVTTLSAFHCVNVQV